MVVMLGAGGARVHLPPRLSLMQEKSLNLITRSLAWLSLLLAWASG